MAVIKRLVSTSSPEPSIPAEPVVSAPSADEAVAADKPAGRRSWKRKGDFVPRDLYQEATDRIIEAIENGTAPWQRAWDSSFRWPVNPTTNKPYHGANVMFLGTAFFQDPRWCSYNQAKARGWQVRKGEQGNGIYFYKPMTKETSELDPETGLPKTKTIPLLKSYTVFNLSQMDGAPPFEAENEHRQLMTDLTESICEEIVEATGATIKYGYRRAGFAPSEDVIYMPNKDTFESDARYYAVLMHEIGHWTGGKDRLNREFGKDRESEAYAREELRAEMASAMLSMHLGLPPNVDNHATYVDHYLKILRNDKKEFFRAAKDAEKITRYVLSFHPDYRDQFEAEHRDQMAAAIDAGGPEEFFDASDFDFEADDIPLHGMHP